MRPYRLPTLLAVGLLAGLLALIAAPRACLACSCARIESPVEALAQSDAVFSGRVAAIVREQPATGYPYLRVTIEVDRFWKGAIGRDVTIYTGINTGICGYPFTQGQVYLVYGYVRENQGILPANSLATSDCTRTRPITQAADDLVALGAGMPLVAASLPSLPRVGGGSWSARAVTISPALLALGLLAILFIGVPGPRHRRT